MNNNRDYGMFEGYWTISVSDENGKELFSITHTKINLAEAALDRLENCGVPKDRIKTSYVRKE